jgi:protein FAM50
MIESLQEVEQRKEERRKNDQMAGQKKKKKKRKISTNKLSFADDFDQDEEADADVPEKPRLGKNPDVDTTFLPDRERIEEERLARQEFKGKWMAEQSRLKEIPINITYSYWDGRGHRKDVEMQQGNTIETFLRAVSQEFPELRGTPADDLMYIKEDLIIPQSFTFYDLIVTKARGKSGPLFNFDVHDDIRAVMDVRVEKNESHAGKVVERRWYERNKHIFPASRWEVFDPQKVRDPWKERMPSAFPSCPLLLHGPVRVADIHYSHGPMHI